MTELVITDINQLTPDWFTTVLRKNGALFTGHVKNITAQRSDSTNTHLVKAHLSFQPASTKKLIRSKKFMSQFPTDLPKNMTCKMEGRPWWSLSHNVVALAFKNLTDTDSNSII
jgi:hypothetical protein